MSRTRLTTRLAAGATAVAAAAALGVSAAPQSGAATAPSASASVAAVPSAQDLAYLNFAAQANLAEIAQGKLAKKISDKRAVREYGAHMVKDHKAQYRALETVATTVGVTLPTKPSKEQRKIAKLFSTLGSGAFNCAYVPFQWGDHQLVIAMTQMEAVQGTDPTVKASAQAALPVLQEHLGHAAKIVKKLKSC